MPLDTVLLLDTSGSMAGRGMRELKRACEVFLDGVEETAKQTNLKENIAIVEFGAKAQLLQGLTNQYERCRQAVRLLKPSGRTPMFDGLMIALKEIITNGGVVTVAGRPLCPRVILMTDGQPTDDKGETTAARDQVLNAAKAFGPQGWKECKLPHPVPIACVGCGDCDPSLLDEIATVTKGMFVIVQNIEELSSFFKRQVLLIRFAAKFAQDMEQLRSRIALAAFLRELGERVEEAELDGLMQFLFAMLCLQTLAGDDDDDTSSGGDDPVIQGLPAHGSRVRRGPDWKWGNQDKSGCGTVIKHYKSGIVEVEWDHGGKNHYRYGAEGATDLQLVGEPRIARRIDEVKPGCKVIRGPDWQWANQDGGPGNIGVVYRIEDSGVSVRVRWPSGLRGVYRNGKDGKHDLNLANVSVQSSGALPAKTERLNISSQSPSKPEREGRFCWQWKDNSGSWRPYTIEQIDSMEGIYQKNPNATCKLDRDSYTYHIDFGKMEQQNIDTKAVRKIRRTHLNRDDFDLAIGIEQSLQLK
ncbi:uncharacterized protein [Oscarella lobularis]|uniref:uncharacterized protein n=1 Tax=Oscarella lobularis TaxID=121494 RepID=UPI003313C23C